MSAEIIVHHERGWLDVIGILHRWLELFVPRFGRITVHHEPQIGHEPLEEHPESDKHCVHVQGEGVTAPDGLQRVFVSGLEVHLVDNTLVLGTDWTIRSKHKLHADQKFVCFFLRLH